jgi:hypothetical protein
MKQWIGLVLLLVSANSHSAGTSEWGVVTQIDVVRHEGILIYGSFGNPSGCTISDRLFLPITSTQYKEMYALLLTAFAQGKEVSMYTSVCTPLTWYSVPSTTYNTVSGDGFALYVRN